MADPTKTCPKCQGEMESGFMIDRSYGATLRESWCDGLPEKGLLGSVKLGGKRILPTVTDRCTACGYLESYAPD